MIGDGGKMRGLKWCDLLKVSLLLFTLFSCPMRGIFSLVFLGGRLEVSFLMKLIKDCHKVPFGFPEQRGYLPKMKLAS